MSPSTHSAVPRAAALALACSFATPAAAGGSGESALILVDPSSAEALHVANYYKHARGIPDANVLYMAPDAASYTAFVADEQEAFFGTLEGRGVEHVDYVVVMPGTGFYVSASGLVSDGCFPVNRFGVAAPFTLAFQSATVLSGTSISQQNRYFGNDSSAIAFDSSIGWLSGQPSNHPNAERYFIGAMLGYTGERGNTVEQILDLIDRSVAVDGTHPAGTFYFLETTDFVRSSPRHAFYPAVTMAILALGGMAEHLMADMPVGETDCQGVMTGLANPAIENGNFTLLPGSFCDHLTSYAGTFDNGSQTKMSEWITKGASGTSGTVEEPCNYAGKFPHARLHLYYFQGLTLGEAWLRSMRYYPFQNLLYGDPLTRPYASIPVVSVPDAPVGPVSGTIFLTPSAAPGGPGAIDRIELYVDGVRARSGELGESLPLDSERYADGWHELRVLAYDDSSVRSVGRWIGSVVIANHGASATLAASATSGDLGTAFDFDLAAPGSTVTELRLVSNGRVLAATIQNPGTVRLYGQNLGAGPVRVQAEALFASGERVRSAPVQLDVDSSGGAVSGLAPVAFDHRRALRVDLASVVELPAAFDDDPSSASTALVTSPAQASVVVRDGYAIVRPTPAASGTDALVFRTSTPSGTSNDATVTLVYEPGFDCAAPASYCSTSPNSVGPGAFAIALGSTSVSENDLTLYATGARPNQPGLFYYGAGQVQQPFGDGFRCVGAGGVGVFRLPILTADDFGDVDLPLDLNAPPAGYGPGAIHAGDTWNFQYWYRDPGSPGGANFNLSDALEIVFCI